MWEFNFNAMFSTKRTSNNKLSWCPNIWPFRICDKHRFSNCEVGMTFLIFDRITILSRLFMLSAPVCGYICEFFSVAIFVIGDNDELSTFVLIVSFMTNALSAKLLIHTICYFLSDFFFLTHCLMLFLVWL